MNVITSSDLWERVTADQKTVQIDFYINLFYVPFNSEIYIWQNVKHLKELVLQN
jgi:hypothetical protein